jgi:hypothetical protein
MERDSNTPPTEREIARIAIEKENTANVNFTALIDQVFEPSKTQLLNGRRYNLNNIPQFNGAGVYAIFLINTSDSPYADRGKDYDTFPIYVGKAVPSGSRQGKSVGTNERSLLKRLKEHAKSINDAHNLDLSKFECSFLIVSDKHSSLIPSVEAYIIRSLTPLWNSAIDGFGNHTPGKGRFGQSPSEWDTLHSGRAFAAKCTGKKPNLENILLKLD